MVNCNYWIGQNYFFYVVVGGAANCFPAGYTLCVDIQTEDCMHAHSYTQKVFGKSI